MRRLSGLAEHETLKFATVKSQKLPRRETLCHQDARCLKHWRGHAEAGPEDSFHQLGANVFEIEDPFAQIAALRLPQQRRMFSNRPAHRFPRAATISNALGDAIHQRGIVDQA